MKAGRYVICRFVSGHECDRRMGAIDAHCGDPGHVRVAAPATPLHQPVSRTESSTRRRPGLAVVDDLEFANALFEPFRDYDPAAFRPNGVWVSRAVQESFSGYHGGSAESAIANIRLVLSRCIEEDRPPRRTGADRWSFSWRGYAVLLSPSLEIAIRT